jgi:hypothetical protein
MNIVTVDGKIEKRDIWIYGVATWQSKMVYMGNICRILEVSGIDKRCTVAYVKRGLYELFSNSEIKDEHVTFVGMLYPETYMYEFLSDHVGYCLKIKVRYPKPTMFHITSLDTHQLYIALSNTDRNGMEYIRSCSKIPNLQCYRILMDVVDNRKPLDLEEFLYFQVRRLEDGELIDDKEKEVLAMLMEKQLNTIAIFNSAIDEYNNCITPLDLIDWYDKYSIIYTEYFGGDLPNANDMVDVFSYSAGGVNIPNHNNIKYIG